MEILTKKGKEKYCHEGFLYVFDRTSSCGTKHFWRCDQRDVDGKARCKARVHTQDGLVVKMLNHHFHDSSAAQVEVQSVKSSIKRRAEDTMEQPAQLINACATGMSEAGQAALPNHGALKKMIRRKRNEINAAPPAPQRVEQLVIPEEYQFYEVNGHRENFLLYDSGPVVNRILIFGRQQNLQVIAFYSFIYWVISYINICFKNIINLSIYYFFQILRESKHWFVDGTFLSAPQLFYQLYVILVEKYGGVHPVAYALLQNKQTATYAEMINRLKELVPDLSPEKISCDFELAAINAFKDAFPEAEILGCLFHLAKNLRKHLGSHHLMGRYKNDANFALQSRMITSLAFIPTGDLDEAVDRLATELPVDLQPILQWFEDSYVGRPNRRGNGRRPPIFSPQIWSVYNRVLDGTDRTNNHAEAAHRRLQTELAMDHPTIWKFIDVLRKVQKGRDIFLEQLVAGHAPPQKRRKYIEADNRIHRIVVDYRNRDLIQYLRGISHNYEMNP